MLEHYYKLFPPSQIQVICTEAIASATDAASTLGDLARWLKLPQFDFTDAVSKGRYNTGQHTVSHVGHRWLFVSTCLDNVIWPQGYEEVTPWGEDEGDTGDENTAAMATAALDAASRNMLEHFFKPFNARLAELSGHPCAWPLHNPGDSN